MNNIFLIGYRGTGKSTVAQLLARRLGWAALDADAVLEQKHGCTIARIFATEGEAGFRDKEEALLGELCSLERHVIATGGGVILRERNRQRLRAAGRVVLLTAAAAVIQERLQGDAGARERRPVLTVGGLAEIGQLLQVREPLYRACADYTVETTGLTPEEVACRIWSWME
jgi:shikimate kinase